MILSVLEHQKIFIGNCRNVDKNQISKQDAEAIRIIDINNKGIFKWGNRFIIPQQWVGTINLSDLSLDILPKISNLNNVNDIKETLLYMLKVTHDIPTKSNINAKVDFAKNGLVEILISNYLVKIEYYLREGLLFSYRKVAKNLMTIKGNLFFAKHINKNILNPTRFYCKYSKLDIDSGINKFIKLTLLEMKKVSRDHANIKRLSMAIIHFEDVSTISKHQINSINLQIDRINGRVSEIIEYGKLFLDGYSVTLSSGNNTISSMLFDMNKIFETFIYKSYKKIYGSNVLFHESKNYLIMDKTGDRKKINLIPDMLINLASGVNIVIDTKWKVVKSFAKESDVYQMNAYVTAIPNVNVTVLMYPKTEGTDSVVGNYKFNNSNTNKELRIRAVDLSLAKDKLLFYNHLQGLMA